jgi:hypothetical protein
MRYRPVAFLKRTLVLLWAVWLTVVLATNVADAAKELGLLGPTWQFASGNFQFLTETTARYGTPTWVNGLLFAGVIGWEGTAAGLFWWCWWRFPDRAQGSGRVYIAFTAALTLWLAFMIADELCIAYNVEGTHLRLLTAQLATLLAIELLPEERSPGPM